MAEAQSLREHDHRLLVPDGSNWTEVGSTTIALTDPVTIGLFVCSHTAGTLNTSTFDNVSVTSP